MLRIIKRALTGGTSTNAYPVVVAEPPDGFCGKPVIDFERCTACDTCAQACPTSAIAVQSVPEQSEQRILSIDYGDCIFCHECEDACPEAIHVTKEFEMAVTDKAHLTSRALYARGDDGTFHLMNTIADAPAFSDSVEAVGSALREKIHRLFGRSLHIREVDAGSCNGCEVEIASLNNPVYDVERFGVHFVASPRHADVLLVTGPVTHNMEIALRQTYEATPDPKFIIAAGACAIGGGVFGKSYASCGGVDTVVPVDVFIPGCPPRPEALLHGILVAIGRDTRKESGQ